MANSQHIEWLLEGKKAWNTRVQDEDSELYGVDVDISGTDIRELFVEHFDLPHLTPTPLSQYLLYGVNFTGATLWNTDFTEANLNSANLTSANLIRTNFTDARLEGTDLTNAELWFANLTRANLRRAKLNNVKLWDANLTGTNLIDADLTGVDLNGTDITKAILYHDIRSVLRLPEQQDNISNTVNSVSEMLGIIKILLKLYNNAETDVLFYFRGEYQNDWQLRPSVMRDDSPVGTESKMLIDLTAQRPEDFRDRSSAIAQWVLAQHHGLKTRFLDITSNPLVALFHACTNAGNGANAPKGAKDGRLHIFAVPPLLVKPFNSDTVSVISNFAKLPRYDQDALIGKTRMHLPHSTSYESAMYNLCQMIRTEKPYFAERIDPRDFYRVLVIEPQQSSERIRAQSGAFLLSAFHERFEREEILKWNERIPVYAHYALDISAESKTEIIEELRLLNVTRQTLFPGLDSAAAAITERYRQKSLGE